MVYDGVMYFADWGGNVYAANVTTGHVLWNTSLGAAISSSVLVANGMVFVGLGPECNVKPTVYALNATDGSLVWQKSIITTMCTIFASPVVYEGRIYIGVAANGAQETNDTKVGELYALNETTGNILWGLQTSKNGTLGGAGGAGVWNTVVVDPTLNNVFFATGNAYGSESGTQLYSYSIISANAITGAMNWHYQAYANKKAGADKDFGSSINLFTVTLKNGSTYQALGEPEKGGDYFVLDRLNGVCC